MKKVIQGSLYNTDTAVMIGTWGNGADGFGFCKETLYRTKAGKYFIHGEGGANSRYGKKYERNAWGWGEQIIPYEALGAREWAEEKLDADDYMKAFGEPEEASDNKTAMTLSFSSDFKRRLERMREETGKSISRLIEEKFSE